jgi:hypothetical protein
MTIRLDEIGSQHDGPGARHRAPEGRRARERSAARGGARTGLRRRRGRLVAEATRALLGSSPRQARCSFVANGERCSPPTAFRIASADGAFDDYTYVCEEHRARVERELGRGMW